MKHNIYFFVFIIFVVLFIPLTFTEEAQINADSLKFQYNEAVDNATDSAAMALLNPITNDSHEILSYGDKEDFQSIDLNLDDGLDTFYRSLYLNLNIEDNKPQQQALLNKIPIIIAAGYDGYYVHTWQVTKINGKDKITNDWSLKKKYSVYNSKYNIKITYTLDDYVYIEDMKTGQVTEGNRQTFASKYPEYFSDEHFDTVRSQVINTLIQDDLDSYTYDNNEIAKRFGWRIEFTTPLWGDRAITTVSFIAFVQGNLSVGVPNIYDSYGFGTAKIAKRKFVYGYIREGRKMYSKGKVVGPNVKIFDTPIEAAKNGYSPDPMYQ